MNDGIYETQNAKDKCKCKVLLIDDEAVVREIGSEMLEALDIPCITAENGERGICLYKEKKDEVELVILDIEMPGITGEQVYDILKEINPHLKILLISGYSINHLEVNYFKRKLDGAMFMSKPFQLSQLSSRLKSIMAMGG
jgi:two-component system, cell cycle sensor histidine kinase and response regulator CckA